MGESAGGSIDSQKVLLLNHEGHLVEDHEGEEVSEKVQPLTPVDRVRHQVRERLESDGWGRRRFTSAVLKQFVTGNLKNPAQQAVNANMGNVTRGSVNQVLTT